MKVNAHHSICFITNIGPHYRFPIFSLIGKTLPCYFYIGDKGESPIKTFNYELLKGYQKTLKNYFFHHFYWQYGSLKLIFKPYKYYILDGEPYCLSSWFILFLAKLLNKKTIAWTHGWYGRETAGKRVLKKIFYSLHDKLMLYNNYSIKLMTEEGFSPNKLYCIANSMNSDQEKTIRESLTSTKIYHDHFKNDYPTIIYCGRIQKRKKIEMIIDSVRLLKDEGVYTNVIIVGKDTEGVNLDLYSQKQGLNSQVWMYGPCYDDKTLGELFYNADVCVSPGNVGLTAIHSLTFGCPVITHGNLPYQMPEFEAIRPGITGDFFEQGNTSDLKEKIKSWISKTPQERERARVAAYDEIDRKWNIHYQIDIINKVIADLNEYT